MRVDSNPPPPHPVRVIGPRELNAAKAAGDHVIWTVSAAQDDWQRELSPFHLGPAALYDGHTARCMENAWQYAKVYASMADGRGEPTETYWKWAREGWSRPAMRYPMGKGAKPLYLLWQGERLDYLQARQRVYWPLYRDSVRNTLGFARLQALHADGPVTLFDFDGYCHQSRGMTLAEVAITLNRPMGHAFVLKAMLLGGPQVEPSDLSKLVDPALSATSAQQELF